MEILVRVPSQTAGSSVITDIAREPPAPDAGAGKGRSDEPERKMGGKRWRRPVLIAVSVGLFAFIIWLGGSESWRTVLAGDPQLYVVAFLLSGIVPALSAWRLQTLVRAATGARVAPWRRFFHINMTGIALGLFLPRNAALLGGKTAYLRTIGVPVLRGSSAVLMENVVDLLFLGTMVIPCTLVMVAGVGERGFLIAIAASVVALLGVALTARGRDWRGLLARMASRLPRIAARLPSPDGGFMPGPARGVPMLGITVLIHVLLASRAYVIASAIGVDAPWLVFAAAYPLAQMGLALAIAPGALGTLDASWLGLLVLGGLSNPEALSFTVALRACIMAFPIVWYGVSALLTLTLKADVAQSTLGPHGIAADEPR